MLFTFLLEYEPQFLLEPSVLYPLLGSSYHRGFLIIFAMSLTQNVLGECKVRGNSFKDILYIFYPNGPLVHIVDDEDLCFEEV